MDSRNSHNPRESFANVNHVPAQTMPPTLFIVHSYVNNYPKSLKIGLWQFQVKVFATKYLYYTRFFIRN